MAPYELYSIDEKEAEGLSEEQIKDIQDELSQIITQQDNAYEVICSLREYLSFLNPQTTAAILKQQNEQLAHELKMKAEEEERNKRLISQKIRECEIETR